MKHSLMDMDQSQSLYVYEKDGDLLPWLLEDRTPIDGRSGLGYSTSGPRTDADTLQRDVPSHEAPFITPDLQNLPPLLDDPTLSLTVLDTLSISTAFHPEAIPHPNTLFSSSDGVIFYVHDQTILDRCPKAFERYLSSPPSEARFGQQIIHLDVPSAELNIILHALYGTSAAAHSPDTATLVNAIDLMPTYGVEPELVIRPLTKLYDLLLCHAPLHPLEIYALAAHHDLTSLATSVSSYLLSYDLTTIADGIAERMGAIYLKKLFVLHLERHRLLKHILLRPPYPHPPTNECDFGDQDKLMRTWALLSAYFVWETPADLSSYSMRSALGSLPERLSCEMCRRVLEDKIKDAVVQWASVKVNIFTLTGLCKEQHT